MTLLQLAGVGSVQIVATVLAAELWQALGFKFSGKLYAVLVAVSVVSGLVAVQLLGGI